MQTIPSDLAVSIQGQLGGLLEQRIGSPLEASHFERDWSPLWEELRDGGWFDFKDIYDDLPAVADVRVDLAFLVENWARFLVPLPFSEALAQALHGLGPATIGSPSPERGFGYRCYPGLLENVSPPSAEEHDVFAPSRPIHWVSADADGIADESYFATLCVLWAAEAVGCAGAAIDAATDHARNRVAYGRSVATFQAIQHLLVDAHVDRELAWTAVVAAAHGPDLAASLRMAADAAARSRRIAECSVQVIGGMGFTWETGVHFYLRHVVAAQKLLRGFVEGTEEAEPGA